MEGCSNCIVGKNVEFFLNPIINFDNANLFIYGNIEQMIYSLLKNDAKLCPFCGYKDDE